MTKPLNIAPWVVPEDLQSIYDYHRVLSAFFQRSILWFSTRAIHPVHLGFHRLLAKRFPYAIYYRLISGEAVVFRVLDCRRDLNWIRKALEKSGSRE